MCVCQTQKTTCITDIIEKDYLHYRLGEQEESQPQQIQMYNRTAINKVFKSFIYVYSSTNLCTPPKTTAHYIKTVYYYYHQRIYPCANVNNTSATAKADVFTVK